MHTRRMSAEGAQSPACNEFIAEALTAFANRPTTPRKTLPLRCMSVKEVCPTAKVIAGFLAHSILGEEERRERALGNAFGQSFRARIAHAVVVQVQITRASMASPSSAGGAAAAGGPAHCARIRAAATLPSVSARASRGDAQSEMFMP